MSKEREYEVGDQVQLRSGGPVTTVIEFVDESVVALQQPRQNWYKVKWFDDKGHVQSESFPEDSLELA